MLAHQFEHLRRQEVAVLDTVDSGLDRLARRDRRSGMSRHLDPEPVRDVGDRLEFVVGQE